MPCRFGLGNFINMERIFQKSHSIHAVTFVSVIACDVAGCGVASCESNIIFLFLRQIFLIS